MAETDTQQQQGDGTVLEEAKSLLVQGRRFMALEDYQSATDCFEQSCQLFDSFYGVAKRETADAYLEYGLALVALANLEAGSGTDRLMKKAGIEGQDEEEEEGEEGDDDEDDDEEEGNEEEDGEQGDEEGEATPDEKAKDETAKEANGKADDSEKNKTTNGTANQNGNQVLMETSNGDSSRADQPQASSSSTANLEPVAGCSGGDSNEEDVENEEPTTIEIAWEVLCLAKRLYMTDESFEGRLKLAETLQKIGEISIEWDNNDNAVSILEECLKIRSAIFKPEDRLIAETYYHLGLAHSFKSDTQRANENFQNAINVIEKRISSLSEDMENAKSAQDTPAVSFFQKEINELKELLPDMTMRLDDSKEDSIKSAEVIKRTREELEQEDEEAKKVCSDKSKPVDDISHLVKRKAT